MSSEPSPRELDTRSILFTTPTLADDMAPLNAKFVPFSAQTRMSGIDSDGVSIRKGAVDAIVAFAEGGSSGPLWRRY